MAGQITDSEHPLRACARAIGGLLDEVMDVDPAYLPVATKQAVLTELAQAAERAHGLLLRVLASADDVATEYGARSASAWLAHDSLRDRAQTASDARLGEALEQRWHEVRRGVLSGAVNLEQARVIVLALDALPHGLDTELIGKAEAHLVAEAGHFGPRDLRVIGRRVLEVVAPDLAEDEERTALVAEERRAAESTRLTMRKRGDGITDIRITASDQVAARLRTYLEAYASPRRGHLDPTHTHTDPESGRPIPYAVLMGRAFCSFLEAIPTTRLPQHGGSATAVVLTIDVDHLQDQLGAAHLTTGEPLSAGEAMRLACTADLMPLVLGGKGEPLHLGRARRLFTTKQRIAMGARDRHCRAEGCDIPAAWCEAHHANGDWVHGGRTDVDDGSLLCGWHHHRAHDPAYAVSRLANGDFRFHRRT